MNIITANEGYVFVTVADNYVCGSIVYLGRYSKKSDFVQVKQEEAEKLKQDQEKF